MGPLSLHVLHSNSNKGQAGLKRKMQNKKKKKKKKERHLESLEENIWGKKLNYLYNTGQ